MQMDERRVMEIVADLQQYISDQYSGRYQDFEVYAAFGYLQAYLQRYLLENYELKLYKKDEEKWK